MLSLNIIKHQFTFFFISDATCDLSLQGIVEFGFLSEKKTKKTGTEERDGKKEKRRGGEGNEILETLLVITLLEL